MFLSIFFIICTLSASIYADSLHLKNDEKLVVEIYFGPKLVMTSFDTSIDFGKHPESEEKTIRVVIDNGSVEKTLITSSKAQGASLGCNYYLVITKPDGIVQIEITETSHCLKETEEDSIYDDSLDFKNYDELVVEIYFGPKLVLTSSDVRINYRKHPEPEETSIRVVVDNGSLEKTLVTSSKADGTSLGCNYHFVITKPDGIVQMEITETSRCFPKVCGIKVANNKSKLLLCNNKNYNLLKHSLQK